VHPGSIESVKMDGLQVLVLVAHSNAPSYMPDVHDWDNSGSKRIEAWGGACSQYLGSQKAKKEAEGQEDHMDAYASVAFALCLSI
jgi:hypothetical protein